MGEQSIHNTSGILFNSTISCTLQNDHKFEPAHQTETFDLNVGWIYCKAVDCVKCCTYKLNLHLKD